MLKLKIELAGTEASRVVIVPKACTLEGLHEVIQGLFGWHGSHPWSFSGTNDMRWEPPSDHPLRALGTVRKDPCATCIGTVLARKGSHLDYTCDFGDNWRYRITRMTDPKDGTPYGCVKTAGPDGVEDCGGPRGLADAKTHVPSLDEINRRIPKAVKTGDYTPPVRDGHHGAVTLRDIVASKDMDVLRQMVAPDGSLPSREECIERTLKLLEEHPETLMIFLCGLMDCHYEIMVEALMNGVGRLDFAMDNEVGLFEGYPYVYVEQRGKGRYKIIAPAELRKIWQKNCISWGLLHTHWNEIQKYASAAARLYGSISIHDFLALLAKYGVQAPYPEEFVAYILNVRSCSGYASHVINGLELRWADFDEEDTEGSARYSDFVSRRLDAPRCENLSKYEFLAYADKAFVEDVVPVRSLLAFMGRECRGIVSPKSLLRKIVGHLVCGDEPAEIVAGLSECTFPGNRKRSNELRDLIEDVHDGIRLPIYNGYTHRELPD